MAKVLILVPGISKEKYLEQHVKSVFGDNHDFDEIIEVDPDLRYSSWFDFISIWDKLGDVIRGLFTFSKGKKKIDWVRTDIANLLKIYCKGDNEVYLYGHSFGALAIYGVQAAGITRQLKKIIIAGCPLSFSLWLGRSLCWADIKRLGKNILRCDFYLWSKQDKVCNRPYPTNGARSESNCTGHSSIGYLETVKEHNLFDISKTAK